MRAHTAFERFSGASHHGVFVVFLVALRMAMGAQFLYAGISKMSGWSAAPYLIEANGPFASWFQSLAGSPAVDLLNIIGLTGIGAALLLGIFVRPAALCGILLLKLYYFSDFYGNTEEGWIDIHVIEAIALALLVSGGSGHVFGLNGFIQEYLRKKGTFIRWLFG